MFEATLSIDLGASYTKVAYRPACNPEQGLIKEEAKIVLIDNNPLIPSLAIRTGRANDQWIFGQQAAGMNPTQDMQVFNNWKADLFRPQNDEASVTAAIIAHRFFEWLRSKLATSGIDLKQCQTRLAMPAFETFDKNALLIARCLDLSGWDNPTLILKVREPHANILGLFTDGKNAVRRNGDGALQASFPDIFADEVYQNNLYMRALREYLLNETRGNLLTVMVVDIGAFTTDLAKLTFDFSAPADGLRAIRQESYELGVTNELDRPLFKALEERHGFSWSEHNFFITEECKRRLYQGLSHPLQTHVGGSPVTIELGKDGDLEILDRMTKKFSNGICEKIQSFATGEIPSHVYLTGGGSLIQPVATTLRGLFDKLNIRVVSVERTGVIAGNGNQRPWRQSGENLQRLATTLGGASVVLQEASSPIQRDAAGIQERTYAAAGRPTCRCQGGNKDCCFCGGRGFYP